ncbi:MAG TPA: hypothetical protein DF610_15210 [Sphingobacterium sp.]|nr:hypothetical protein FM120_20755 [Sphingobacterium faecium PCAi_F2.5]HCU46016.1 hypothetical protein [Sphingobacterium sp.]
MRTLLKRAIGATSVCALAAGMVLGANAFTKKDRVELHKVAEEVLQNETWYFTGGSSDDPTDPNLYTQTPPTDGCLAPYQKVCEIQAPNDGSDKPKMDAPINPSSSETVEEQIESAHSSLSSPSGPQTNSTVTAFRSN